MLTERQIKLIEAIINEYINTSEPVGSVELVDRYNLKFSAATVRNEMARLIEMGFLQMLHASSGRVPTKSAYRFYLTDLMDEFLQAEDGIRDWSVTGVQTCALPI